MAKPRTFSPALVLTAARAGTLTTTALRKAVKTAEDFGLREVARELTYSLVSADSFAADETPAEVRERLARGYSALLVMGARVSRIVQMLKKQGVIATLDQIVELPDSARYFEQLTAAGLQDVTVEAVILDHPQLFSDRAVAAARSRLHG